MRRFLTAAPWALPRPMLLLAVLLCGWFVLGAQSPAPVPLDTALERNNQAVDDHAYISALNLDLDSLLLEIHQTRGRAEREGTADQRAKAYSVLALFHYYQNVDQNPDSTRTYDSLTLVAYREAGDEAGIVQALGDLGNDYVLELKYRQAEPLLLEAAERLVPLKDTLWISYRQADLAELYLDLRDTARAREYSDAAYATALTLRDSTSLMRAANTRQGIREAVGDYAGAVEDGEFLVRQALRENNGLRDGWVAMKLAYRGKSYRLAGRLEEALKDHREAYAIVRRDRPEPGHADGMRSELGKTLTALGRYAEAIPHLRSSLEWMTDKAQVGTDREESLTMLARAYAGVGKPDSALYYRERAFTLERNRLLDQVASMGSELRIKYDTDRREATIAAQAATLETSRRTQFLIGALLLLTLLGAVGLFLGLRNNRRQNRELTRQNARNEVLLREIHHRVKNNLETVSSLLELQAATLTDTGALAAMRAGQSRVQSIGLLHQKLYREENLAAIRMDDYLTDLATTLLETYEADGRIHVTVSAPTLDLDVDRAIPLGLIANELLTNSIKYAFPRDHFGADAGAVELTLEQGDERAYVLRVADNGIGHDGADDPRGTGFGTQLITLLTRQLQGEFRTGNRTTTGGAPSGHFAEVRFRA